MRKSRFDLFEFITFLMTPEDSTDRHPDPALKMYDPESMYLPRHYHVLKTFFWVFMAVLLSVVISQFG